MSGYYRYPWGGVEIGGLLFGKIEAGAVQIYSFREAECEHQYGPAFELSQKDEETFGRLLATATEEQRVGLTPVGWYLSVSRRDVSLSDHAMATFQRFFPSPKQIAMVLKRSKNDPFSVGIFRSGARGKVELYSRTQEFTLDNLRRPQPSAVPESLAREAELSEPVLKQPSLSEEQQQSVLEQPPTVPHDHGLTGPSVTEDRPQPVLEPTMPEPPPPALAESSFNEDHPQPLVAQLPALPRDHGLARPSVTEDRSQAVVEPTTPEPPPPALAQPSFNEDHPHAVVEQTPTLPRDHGLTRPSVTEDRPQPVLEPTIPEPAAPALAQPSFSEEQQEPAGDPPMLPSSAAFSRSSLTDEQSQPIIEPTTLESPAPALTSAPSSKESSNNKPYWNNRRKSLVLRG